jgi:hypothetical protein
VPFGFAKSVTVCHPLSLTVALDRNRNRTREGRRPDFPRERLLVKVALHVLREFEIFPLPSVSPPPTLTSGALAGLGGNRPGGLARTNRERWLTVTVAPNCQTNQTRPTITLTRNPLFWQTVSTEWNGRSMNIVHGTAIPNPCLTERITSGLWVNKARPGDRNPMA